MNINKFTELLNGQQLKAVTAELDSNLLVLAGAGSGKTRVLVYRIFWLLQHGINASNILAVTFTNKAAAEMRSRVEQMLRSSLDKMWVGTFHGLAHRLLRIHWNEAELLQSFQVIDAEDQLRLLKRIHKSFNLDEERWPPKQTQSYINNNKDSCLRSKNIRADNLIDATLLKIYQEYENACQRSGLVDFSELLLRSYELLLHNPELLQLYKRRFQYILVDEFQDTNSLQYAWVKLLAKDSSNLMVVGDDDQSIYSWRGANVENMQHLTHDFINMQVILLEQNYRSTGTILQASNAVIANNSGRLDKKLWTNGISGDPLTLYAAFDEFEEARYISNVICKLKDLSRYTYNDIAVLYRSNAQSRVLEEQLLRYQIPYVIYGGLRFYERAEIKDALAYLRLVANHKDDAAFERIFNMPARGLGDTTLLLLREYAWRKQMSLFDAAQEMSSANQLPTRAAKAVVSFLELLHNFKQQVTELELHDLVDFVAKKSGLREHFAKDKSERGLGKVENIDELVSAAKQFSMSMQENDNADLLNLFLAHAFLESSEEVQNKIAKDRVQLMTLHAAKGLEFPVVFMCGMEDGLFPHIMSMEENAGLEEERRLCYVGMTRAMRSLLLTYASMRRVYGSNSLRKPSRFLGEIPPSLISREGHVSVTRPIIAQSAQKNLVEHFSKYSEQSIVKNKTVSQAFGNLVIGQRVRHVKFGEGTIIGFEGNDEKLLIQVKFNSVGNKWLAANVAKLEII